MKPDKRIIIFQYPNSLRKNLKDISKEDIEGAVLRIFKGLVHKGETLLGKKGFELANCHFLKGRMNIRGKNFRFVVLIRLGEIRVVPIKISSKNSLDGDNLLITPALLRNAHKKLNEIEAGLFTASCREVQSDVLLRLPNGLIL